MGILALSDTPEGFWPHYLLLSFYLAAGLIVLMVILSLLTGAPAKKFNLPSIAQIYNKLDYSARPVWIWWTILACIMVTLYLFFQLAGTAG